MIERTINGRHGRLLWSDLTGLRFTQVGADILILGRGGKTYLATTSLPRSRRYHLSAHTLDRIPILRRCHRAAHSTVNRPGFCAAFFVVKIQDSGRESARSRFRLRAATLVENWPRASSRERAETRPLVVPRTGLAIFASELSPSTQTQRPAGLALIVPVSASDTGPLRRYWRAGGGGARCFSASPRLNSKYCFVGSSIAMKIVGRKVFATDLPSVTSMSVAPANCMFE